MAFPEPILDELSDLIERMTQPDGRPSHVPKMSRWKRWTALVLIAATVLGTVTIVVVGLWQRHSTGAPVHLSYGWALLSVVPNAGLLLLILYDLVEMVWQQWRKPWGTIYQQFRGDMQVDAAYVAALKMFPKDLLEYALLQYRHRWGRVDGRTVLLAGDIRKLGLFPGLLAIFVAAPKLLEGQSNLWLWQPIALVGAFHLVAFAVAAASERRSQVIDLLQYAIDRADATPPEAGENAQARPGMPDPPLSSSAPR